MGRLTPHLRLIESLRKKHFHIVVELIVFSFLFLISCSQIDVVELLLFRLGPKRRLILGLLLLTTGARRSFGCPRPQVNFCEAVVDRPTTLTDVLLQLFDRHLFEVGQFLCLSPLCPRDQYVLALLAIATC